MDTLEVFTEKEIEEIISDFIDFLSLRKIMEQVINEKFD